jgi:hypothetical protein
MATRFEDQPWHQEWREALDRVIAAQMRRDGAKLGTPEREAANREHEAALAAFRALAEKIRPPVLMRRATVKAVGTRRPGQREAMRPHYPQSSSSSRRIAGGFLILSQ